MDAIARKLAEKIEADLYATICGGHKAPRPTALRVRGSSFETVEIDDAGNVIEPMRCTCGNYTALHHSSCPFWGLVT